LSEDLGIRLSLKISLPSQASATPPRKGINSPFSGDYFLIPTPEHQQAINQLSDAEHEFRQIDDQVRAHGGTFTTSTDEHVTLRAGPGLSGPEILPTLLQGSGWFASAASFLTFLKIGRDIILKWLETSSNRSVEVVLGNTKIHVKGYNDLDAVLTRLEAGTARRTPVENPPKRQKAYSSAMRTKQPVSAKKSKESSEDKTRQASVAKKARVKTAARSPAPGSKKNRK
jgi:hypothetical protein